MAAPATQNRLLDTPAGPFPLYDLRLSLAGREWSILHTGAVLTHADEASYFHEVADRLPYGLALWPSALALAREVAERAEAFRGTRVLELGAGTGLPGIVAASLGARVVQTDQQEVTLSVCRRNGIRNAATSIEYRLADWAEWDAEERYDWIVGSDIVYSEATHPHLERIFTNNLAPGGRVLISDPVRYASMCLLERLEEAGWSSTSTERRVGEGASPRVISLYELVPPREPVDG
jgi:methyltransferase-like protein 23